MINVFNGGNYLVIRYYQLGGQVNRDATVGTQFLGNRGENGNCICPIVLSVSYSNAMFWANGQAQLLQILLVTAAVSTYKGTLPKK